MKHESENRNILETVLRDVYLQAGSRRAVVPG